jgi:hypothetical protein
MEKIYRIVLISFVSVFLLSSIVYAANTIISVQPQSIWNGDTIAVWWYQDVNDSVFSQRNTIATITGTLNTLSWQVSSMSWQLNGSVSSQWSNYPNNTVPTGIYYPIGNVGIWVMPTDVNTKLKVSGVIETSSWAGTTGWIKFPDGTLQTTAYSGSTGGDGTPVGTISAFFTSSCPTGWVTADGTNGTPDLRWEFIRWLDNGRGVDSGRSLGSWQKASHIRNFTDTDAWGGWTPSVYFSATNADINLGYEPASNTSNTNDYQFSFTRTNWYAQALTPWYTRTIRPRNIALLYCMKLSWASSTPSNSTTWTRVGNDVVQASTGVVQVNSGVKFPDGSIQTTAATPWMGLWYWQTWQMLTSSRSEGVIYTNTTWKPIYINISTLNDATSNEAVWINVDWMAILLWWMSKDQRRYTASAIVPAWSTYQVGLSHYGWHSIAYWAELR